MIPLSLTLRTIPEEKIHVRDALMLAWSLIGPLSELLRSQSLSPDALLPSYSKSSVSLAGKIEDSPDMYDSASTLVHALAHASSLLTASENLIKSDLADRMLRPDARLPIRVTYDQSISSLLTYDANKDLIACKLPNWEELTSSSIKILKPLSRISSAGLSATLQVGASTISFPSVSPTIFGHGFGAGHLLTGVGFVTGMYRVAGEIELRIEGFRNGRVFRAQLSDAARLAAECHEPPYTVAMKYSEAAPHLPLLPAPPGKVTIDSMWDFELNKSFDFSDQN